jgi:tetratricopeptide (TPR) repeat protein
MFWRVTAAAMLLTLFVPIRLVGAQDAPESGPAPDASAVRQQVDTLIKGFHDAKQRATPGMIQEAVALSISFGAPTWNHGDHGACSRFYVKTAQSLITMFPDKTSATPAARDALDELQLAVDRARTYGDDDRSAWSLRYAFDKNQLSCDLAAQKTQAMVALGEQYLKRSQLQESEDALRGAVSSLSELDGEPVDAMPVAARYAPLALANALFAEEQFDDASAAILKGLQYIPQWPAVSIDLREANGTPAEYQTYLTALENKARTDPKNASVQFLLGYQYWFTGRHADALDCFHQTLKLNPNHAGAQIFLNPDAGKTDPNKPKA